jgi:hypothetical protein
VRHWGDPVHVSYDSTSFWYAQPGTRVSGLDAPLEQLVLPVLEVGPPSGAVPGPYRCGG